MSKQTSTQMGSIIYNFLADSLFLNNNALKNDFANESDARLEKELTDYRAFCIDNLDNLIEEITQKNTPLSVFSSSEETPIDTLKQTALYLDQYVVADPIFRLTNLDSSQTKVMAQHLGFKDGLSRETLKKGARYLKEIVPMVAGNFVKIFPVSYHFEKPKQLPLNLPVDNYNGILPKEILEYFHKNARVTPMSPMEGGGYAILDNQVLEPCRAITIDFERSFKKHGLLFFLMEMEVIAYDEKTGKATFKQYLPAEAPEEEHFQAWVNQSINSSSKSYFDEVFGNIFISSKLNSSYICDNTFANDLISRNFNAADSIQSFTTNQMLNIDLPFLKNIDADKLMAVREFDADVFTNFRIELEKQFRELRTITDPYQLKLKTENLFHELNDVQGRKIKLKMQHLKGQMFLNTILAVGGLAGSISTGGISLLSTAVALGKGYKDFKDYQEKVKENPAYFLWKSQH